MLNGIKSVWQAVVNLPSLIADNLKGFFDSVKDAILSIPTAIIDAIKDIFIPDTDYIDTAFDNFLADLQTKFGIDTTVFENLFKEEKVVEDVNANYNIPGVGTLNLKFLDVNYLVKGVDYFRPFVRGFLILLMFFFHISKLIGFFGYNAGVVAGRTDEIHSSIREQRRK